MRPGVLLEVEAGTLPDYIQAVASADSLGVDLSQFQVVRDQRHRELVDRLTAALLTGIIGSSPRAF